MSRNKAAPVIRKMVKKIVAETKPEKVILFGSYAWGRPHEWSDVDLFILKRSKKNRLDRQRDVHRILYGYDFPPSDILVYTPEEAKRRISMNDLFIKDILRKGKILYERSQSGVRTR